jgi:hypothetical protein
METLVSNFGIRKKTKIYLYVKKYNMANKMTIEEVPEEIGDELPEKTSQETLQETSQETSQETLQETSQEKDTINKLLEKEMNDIRNNESKNNDYYKRLLNFYYIYGEYPILILDAKVEDSCCDPKVEDSCCDPKVENDKSGCCDPKVENSCCDLKVENDKSGCCAPKVENSCCDLKVETISKDINIDDDKIGKKLSIDKFAYIKLSDINDEKLKNYDYSKLFVIIYRINGELYTYMSPIKYNDELLKLRFVITELVNSEIDQYTNSLYNDILEYNNKKINKTNYLLVEISNEKKSIHTNSIDTIKELDNNINDDFLDKLTDDNYLLVYKLDEKLYYRITKKKYKLDDWINTQCAKRVNILSSNNVLNRTFYNSTKDDEEQIFCVQYKTGILENDSNAEYVLVNKNNFTNNKISDLEDNEFYVCFNIKYDYLDKDIYKLFKINKLPYLSVVINAKLDKCIKCESDIKILNDDEKLNLINNKDLEVSHSCDKCFTQIELSNSICNLCNNCNIVYIK